MTKAKHFQNLKPPLHPEGGMNMATQEECKKSYAEGVKEAKQEGFLDGLAHGLVDNIIPENIMDDEEPSRQAGYEDYKTGKAK